MKYLKYLFAGFIFGITFIKSEVVSWYRIHEMFRFESFHMYGIIGSAVILGIIGVAIIKRLKLQDVYGQLIVFNPKDHTWPRYILGGIIFGFGWALVGSCPGPMFALLGYGYLVFLVVIAAALLGTFVYGLLREKIPH